MSQVSASLRRSRLAMINRDSSEVEELCSVKLGIRDGDLIEFYRGSSRGPILSKGRVIGVEKCYGNVAGGHTAWLRVVPMLVGEKLGNSRIVLATTTQKGNLEPGESQGWMVRRVSDSVAA